MTDQPREAIAILDFGSQYSQLIARRVREAHVYCEMFRWDAPPDRVLALEPRGFILSGGPASVYDPGAPTLPAYVLGSGLPVLGICYGMQLLIHTLDGRVAPAREREYGPAQAEVLDPDCPLFAGLPPALDVWMSHGDRVEALPPGFAAVARTADAPVAAIADVSRGLYGLQFHPEVTHTPRGPDILANWLHRVCGLHDTWTPGSFVREAVARIRAHVGEAHVLCAVSGGVDSAVMALLVGQAVGDRLVCVFVDHGLLRRDEAQQVLAVLNRHLPAEVMAVDARERFLTALAGVEDPEAKRRIIGETFVRVFEEEARRLRTADAHLAFLAQGTLYPDVIESDATERGGAAVIKHHHNVSGLPPDMSFKLIEPLRSLFKDEVRQVGRVLGLPHKLLWRHPFPGPGLAIRILGESTWERLETLRKTDAIFLQELEEAGWYSRVAQAFAVLLPEARSTGVAGDAHKFGQTIVLRAVETDDFMTASPALLPYELLTRVSSRILNEVTDITRVVYDLSTKPPATIEWL